MNITTTGEEMTPENTKTKEKKTRKLKMWMVTGKCGGLRSLETSRWHAEQIIETGFPCFGEPIPVNVTIVKLK